MQIAFQRQRGGICTGVEFHAIDDDDDGPYVPGHHYDDIGRGRLNFIVGDRSGVPLAFRTDGGVESARITLKPL